MMDSVIVIEQPSATAEIPQNSACDQLMLTWEERAKTRQRVTTRHGRELVIKLATGKRLMPGAIVAVGEGFHIQVAAADEDQWLVSCPRPADLARVAYELGNRHFPCQIEAAAIGVRYDHTLAELWHRLGARAERVRRPFIAEFSPHGHH